MAYWLTLYCTAPVSQIGPEQLLAGICGRDPGAPAGVDYHTLAEDYEGTTDELVDEALAHLRVEARGPLPLDSTVAYAPGDTRGIAIHCWTDPARVIEEIEEVDERRAMLLPPDAGAPGPYVEVIGIELGVSQLSSMGIVIAFEIARYLAQKGEAMLCDDDGQWLVVIEGAFEEP